MVCEYVLNRVLPRLNPVLSRVGLTLCDCHCRIYIYIFFALFVCLLFSILKSSCPTQSIGRGFKPHGTPLPNHEYPPGDQSGFVD